MRHRETPKAMETASGDSANRKVLREATYRRSSQLQNRSDHGAMQAPLRRVLKPPATGTRSATLVRTGHRQIGTPCLAGARHWQGQEIRMGFAFRSRRA